MNKIHIWRILSGFVLINLAFFMLFTSGFKESLPGIAYLFTYFMLFSGCISVAYDDVRDQGYSFLLMLLSGIAGVGFLFLGPTLSLYGVCGIWNIICAIVAGGSLIDGTY